MLGGVAAVSPEVGGGGHSGLGQMGKEEERSTPLCLDLPGSQCKCKPRQGDQAAEVSF